MDQPVSFKNSISGSSLRFDIGCELDNFFGTPCVCVLRIYLESGDQLSGLVFLNATLLLEELLPILIHFEFPDVVH